jgi:hypothetical protein
LATSTDPGVARLRLVLALLAVLPFAPSLFHPFFADDSIHLERALALAGAPWSGLARGWILNAADAAAWWSPPGLAVVYFRPLVMLSFLADATWWGLSAAGFHLTNLLLHAATTVLVHALAVRLLPTPRAALAAAGLFALHPCHAEAVLWVSGRTDLLAGLGSVAAVVLYVASRRSPHRRGRRLSGSLIALALALLAKESAVIVPGLLLLYEWGWPDAEPARRRLIGPALAVAVVGAYAGLRLALLGGVSLPPHPFAHGPGDPDLPAHAVMAPLLYLADLVLFVPPDPVITGPWWRAHLWLFAALAGLAVAALVSSVRRVRDVHLARFGLGWIALSLLPAAPLSLGERFLYLPSVGYCLLIGAGAGALAARDPRSARRQMAAVGVLAAAVALARTVGFGVLAGRARETVDDAVAALRANPGRSLLLVVDLPPAAALGFAHALRLERPAPLEVELLTLAPSFLRRDQEASEVSAEDGRLVLRRRTPYLTGYIDRAFLGERAPFAEGHRVERPSLAVTVRDVAQGGPRALEVTLRPAARPRSLLLRGQGWRLRADPAAER